MTPRMKTTYRESVLPAMLKEGDYGNVMRIPKIEKIVVNTCLKEAITSPKLWMQLRKSAIITGQSGNLSGIAR